MKNIIFLLLTAVTPSQAQWADGYQTFDRLLMLEVKPDTRTNVSFGDINKDRFVDLVVLHRDDGQSYVYTGSLDIGAARSNGPNAFYLGNAKTKVQK